ncbi:hypothetical protein I9W82_000399 [Candida metapsilosis]|uniref:Uncharacterized protein n=1 Tax=Candida metapsilosis TaxID=273372 RepID=A0A8H8DCZ0_9ASCO|nr:hypothetical protein I9W82_000399 [Candida metapsilosis]
MSLYATYYLKQQPPRAIASNSMLENFDQATNEEANLMRMYNLAQHSNMSKRIMLPTKRPTTILESSKDARERTYPLASIAKQMTLLEKAANRTNKNAANDPMYSLTQEFEQLSLTTYEDMQPKPTIPNCFWLLNEDDPARLKRRWEESRIDDRFPNFESPLYTGTELDQATPNDVMNDDNESYKNEVEVENEVEDEYENVDEDENADKDEYGYEHEYEYEYEDEDEDEDEYEDEDEDEVKIENEKVEVEQVKVEDKKVEIEQVKVEQVKVEQVEAKQVEVEQVDTKIEHNQAEVKKVEVNQVEEKKDEDNSVWMLDKPDGQGRNLKIPYMDERLPNVEQKSNTKIKNEPNQATDSEVKVDDKIVVKKEVVELKSIGDSSLEKLSLPHTNQKEKETKGEDEDVEKDEETSSNQSGDVPNVIRIEGETYLNNEPKGKENTKWNQKWIKFVTLKKQKPKSGEVDESVGKKKSSFKGKLKHLFQRKRKWVPFETTGEVDVLFDADDYKDEEDTKLETNVNNGNESTSNEDSNITLNTENETTVNDVDVRAAINNDQENIAALDACEPEGQQAELTKLDAVIEPPAIDTPPLNPEDADVATKVGLKKKAKVMRVLKKLIKPFKRNTREADATDPIVDTPKVSCGAEESEISVDASKCKRQKKKHKKRRSSSKRKKIESTEPASDADKITEDVAGAECDLPKQAEVEGPAAAPLVLKPIIKIRDDSADGVTGAKRKVKSKRLRRALDVVKASFRKTFRRKTSKVRFADTNECFIVERYDHKRKEELVPQLLENEEEEAVTEEDDATEDAQSLLNRCVGRPSTEYNATPSLINDEQNDPRSNATPAEEAEEEDIENLDSYRPPPTDEKLDIDPQTGQFFGSRGFTNEHYKPRKNRVNYSRRPTIHQIAHEKMKSEQIRAAQATGRWVQNPRGNWIYEDKTKWWLNGGILDYRTYWK